MQQLILGTGLAIWGLTEPHCLHFLIEQLGWWGGRLQMLWRLNRIAKLHNLGVEKWAQTFGLSPISFYAPRFNRCALFVDHVRNVQFHYSRPCSPFKFVLLNWATVYSVSTKLHQKWSKHCNLQTWRRSQNGGTRWRETSRRAGSSSSARGWPRRWRPSSTRFRLKFL